jgi:DNA polymerase-3 subunit gamma/tau
VFDQKRAGKKKGLTDPVELIPFAGQSLRPGTAPAKAKPSEPQERPTIAFKKEVKTLSVPTGQLQTGNISVKQEMLKHDDPQGTQIEDISNRPQKPFSLDELKMVWRQFAFKLKEDGIETLYLAMIKRDPKMPQPTHVHQEFDNQVQIDYMQIHQGDLQDFLRNKLQNWALTIEFSIIESQEENIKLLTGKDRFAALARKNPNLYSLQKTFNLDIDY